MEKEQTKLYWKKTIIIAGAFCSYMIGAGFASGQEVLQFYTSFGTNGFLAALVALAIFAPTCYITYGLGKQEKFENPYDVYRYYSGKIVGTGFEWYSIALFYGIYVIMLAGAGAAVKQYYGIPSIYGSFGMAILVFFTVILGLEKLVNIIGTIGPAIIAFTIIIGIAAIADNPGGITSANRVIATLPQVTGAQAAPNWFLSGALYAGFCLVIGYPFFVSCGEQAHSVKEARIGGVAGVTAFVAAIMMIIAAELINIADIADAQIPTLVIAKKLVPVLGLIFSIIIMCGIFTTASPLLWATVRKFAADKTKKSYILTAVLTGVGMFFGGLLPFNQLVGLLYPIAGYLGLVFIVFIIVKEISKKNKSKKQVS